MSFVLDPLVYIIAASVLILFNLGLGIWLYRLSRHYNSLTRDVTHKTLMEVLEGIQKTLATHERTLASHKKNLAGLDQDGQNHVQRLALRRFNPYSDTGGDQSFILAMLDGNKDGVVITSLHSRENTRFYVKEVKRGKGVGHALSAEEQKLL